MDFSLSRSNESTDSKQVLNVYAEIEGRKHWLGKMIAGLDDEAIKNNRECLNYKRRLQRSGGKYVMVEGSIFNPIKLMEIATIVSNFEEIAVSGGEYKNGYTELRITADFCPFIFRIYSENCLKALRKLYAKETPCYDFAVRCYA